MYMLLKLCHNEDGIIWESLYSFFVLWEILYVYAFKIMP